MKIVEIISASSYSLITDFDFLICEILTNLIYLVVHYLNYSLLKVHFGFSKKETAGLTETAQRQLAHSQFDD